MKRRMLCTLLAALLLTAAGCGKTDGTASRTGSQSPTVDDVLASGVAQAEQEQTAPIPAQEAPRQSGIAEGAPAPEAEAVSETPQSAAEGVDIDLTVMSSAMVYAEVFDMMEKPHDYIGKVVKMRGTYGSYHDTVNDVYYFACVIEDATACCAQGIEFVLTDEYTYPDDYPEEGGEVTVVGTFDTYMEGEYEYCTLRGARLV